MIRRFKKSDAEKCSRLINTCHKSMPELHEKELNFLLNKYTPEFARKEFPKEYVLVYEENGEILGFAALLKSGEMRWLYVDPKKQRKGIGKALIKELEKEAKKRGFHKVVLKSYYESRKFYEKMGYKVVQKDSSTFGDATFNSFIMEKELVY